MPTKVYRCKNGHENLVQRARNFPDEVPCYRCEATATEKEAVG